MVENPYKIALVGTSSVGKTTVFNRLRELYNRNPQVSFVKEAARDYFLEHPEIQGNDRFSFDPQLKIQMMMFEREAGAQYFGVKAIVVDSSVFGAPVCVKAFGDNDGADLLMRPALNWARTYNKIYLLDPSVVSYKNDNIRTESEAERDLFHQVYIDLFNQYQIQYQLLGETLSGKVNILMTEINSHLKTLDPLASI